MPNQNARAEAERSGVSRQAKGIDGGGRGREKVLRARVETMRAVGVQMHGGREEKIHALADAAGNHRLQIVVVFFGEIAVAFDTGIRRQRKRRVLVLRDPVVAETDFDCAAKPALAQRRAVCRDVKLVGNAVGDGKRGNGKAVKAEQGSAAFADWMNRL